MSSVNKAIIMGRLGGDPEIKNFDNGNSVCSFSVATSDTWKDKETGEKKERTDWHRVAIFNEGLIKVAEQYLHKGDLVYLEGEIRTRKYEKNGVDHYATEIVLPKFRGEVRLMPKGGSGGSTRSEEDYGQTRTRDTGGSSRAPDARQSQPASGGPGRYGDLDGDDIPFAPEWRG